MLMNSIIYCGNGLHNYSRENDFYNILKNNLTVPKEIPNYEPKNILLTGATGFLGAHILSEIIDKTNAKVYCLIRKDPGYTSKQKLESKLNYYFKEKYNNLVGERIGIIEGDIADIDLSLYKDCIDVVINSAALVSHFGNYSDFLHVNVHGTKNLLEFCKKYNKKIYHISTLSVSGNSFVDSYSTVQDFEHNIDYTEANFYIGQNIDNLYVKSKFEAEQLVLTEIENGLEAYILRVGNLMPRFSDGVFQENALTNSYMNRLATFLKLKVIPKNIKRGYVEFTPIDYCAMAIILIITHPTVNNSIYHLFNHHHIYINKLLKILNDLDYNINVIEKKDFKNLIQDILKDNEKKNILNHLINDFNNKFDLNYMSKIKIKSDFTIKFLKELEFDWPIIDSNYISNILSIIERL